MLQFVLALAISQNPEIKVDPAETHGKTPEQIVAMGYEKWYEFYIEKEQNESTMAINFANMLYGNSLYIVNTNRLKAVEPKRRQMIADIRESLVQFRGSCIEIGFTRSGGGTLWSIIHSATRSESEGLVADLIAGSQKGERATQATVWAKLNEVAQKIEREKDDLEEGRQYSNRGYAEAMKYHAEAVAHWTNALPKIAKFPKVAERERIMNFYLEGAEIAWQADM
ncbi:MAG: hypothetical protein KF836_09945 [Fimbriimonadaceae bacterium]|nr:hypothetical protein [Fimbriimonadaceae bacterium]